MAGVGHLGVGREGQHESEAGDDHRLPEDPHKLPAVTVGRECRGDGRPFRLFPPMPIAATNIRRGMAILFGGEPCRVIEFHHHTPGNLRAMVHAKLRKLKSGVTVEHRFRASDTVEEAHLETHELQFLYRSGSSFHFMNTENYEQVELDGEALGDAAQWMADGMVIIGEFYEGKPVAVDLPNQLTLQIVETSPVMRGATKTSSTKPAKLSNGVTINVPEFIPTGEKVRVNPNTGEYIDRAKE